MAQFLPLRYDKMAIDELVGYLEIRGYFQNPGVKAVLDHRVRVAEAFAEKRGRIEEAQSLILRLGTVRFGKPSKKMAERLSEMVDLRELEALADRLMTATGWKDLLAAPVA